MKKQEKPAFAQIEHQLNQTRERNLNGSLEQCKDELRDAYMNFKDLQNRCVINIKTNQTEQESDEHRVFYFKPETFLLDDAEKQRQFRESMLNKISTLPKPDAISYMGDDLHRSMCQTVADRSAPTMTKKFLAQYFKRRQYTLQHMKYKLLCRWAHQTLTSELMEVLSPEATFMYGKLEFNLEQSMSRHERLSQNDFYESLTRDKRPSTKSDESGGALYVENFDIPQQSLIREDDIEVFIRGTQYRNKINKVINKLMSRLKWIPMQEKYRIFEKSIEEYFKQKNANIQRQKMYYEKVKQRTNETMVMTTELEAELNEVLRSYYCSSYDDLFMSKVDRITNGWKANHDEVPKLISDNQMLKIRVLEIASKFNIGGDIYSDRGFAFSYQITTFFPIYFQKQVIKAQFSIYDAFGQETDQNENKKNTLFQMTQIDANIFRDLTTQKGSVPSSESLRNDFKNAELKILRLKSAKHWIDYIVLTPTEAQWQQKQSAVLNCDNPEDSLLRRALDFLDNQDMATISRIIEDQALLHQENVAKLRIKDPHNKIQKFKVQTSDGEKSMNVDVMPLSNSLNFATNIEKHLLKTVQDYSGDSSSISTQQSECLTSPRVVINSGGQSIKTLPTHLLSAYFTLRFMSSRDYKTRILYTLNYFRSVQKRFAIDLREFATRDRIDGVIANPYIQSQEASNFAVNQVKRQSSSSNERVERKPTNMRYDYHLRKMTVFDEDAIKEMQDMASMRAYKLHGLFNNKIFNTCPSISYPQMHTAHGEPVVHQSVDEERERQAKIGFSEQSVKLMNRIEHVEINESLQEVYIKDDFGIYIIYDCVLQDMKNLEDELCKIGSYFLSRSEVLLDPQTRPIPVRDREELLSDILAREAEFQFNKVKLCQVYMECYEHITDPLEQQRLMQVVTNIMARRPRLNLNANYFIDGYDAEIYCLKEQFKVVKLLVDLQISLEKTENKRLQDSLNLSYSLANQYAKNKWKYQDAESLLKALHKATQAKKKKEKFNAELSSKVNEDVMKIQEQLEISSNQSRTKSVLTQVEMELKQEHNRDPGLIEDGLTSHQSSIESEVFEENEDKFTQLLGLPTISIETIYQSYKEKDVTVLNLMREHNNFINVYEGYPEFLTMLTHGSIFDRNRVFKPNSWSQETGALDFYDTLDFVNKFYSLTQQIQQELYDGLQMWDTSMMTQIDIQVALIQLEELHKIISFQEGSETEYEGRNLVEDETIVGNSDKTIFYVKEAISDFQCKPLHLLNHFVVAKLDMQSILNFDFPQIEKQFNKYAMRFKGIYGAQFIMKQEKECLKSLAQSKAMTEEEQEDKILGIRIEARQLKIPGLLTTYCNLAEFLRLRHEIILAATETQILTQIYKKQSELLGVKNCKVELEQGIIFTNQGPNEEQEQKFVNYLEDGPSHLDKIELAIREFDPALLSNFNFRNPDSLKLNILTSGLEEVRAILQYQIMQKHLLIVATRINSLVIDNYERVLSELNLIQTTNLCIPNSIFNYQKVMNRGMDSINQSSVNSQKQQFKINLTSQCKPLYMNIMEKKLQSRSTILNEYQTYKAKVVLSFPNNPTAVSRVMRCYRVKIITKFVQKVMIEVHLEAQKIQALQTCSRLRVFNRFFNFDAKSMGLINSHAEIFKYETSKFLENFPINYLPEGYDDDSVQEFKCINTNDYIIQDHTGIPSSYNLLSANASPLSDIQNFNKKRAEIKCKMLNNLTDSEDLKDQNPELNEPEVHLKRLLPTFTPDESFDSQKQSDDVQQTKLGQNLDYQEALYFGESKFSQMIKYYAFLERIITIEWFIIQLGQTSGDIVNFQHSIESGLSFFREDEFNSRARTQLKTLSKQSNQNSYTQEILAEQVKQMRQKRHIAESVQSLGVVLKNFIAQYTKTRPEQRFEYLRSYSEFRYQQVISSLYKLVQSFYHKQNVSTSKKIQQTIAQITKMDHMRLIHLKPNNFSVSSCTVSPNMQGIDSGNLLHGSLAVDDMIIFQRCIQPLLNERALEPSQITLFQSMYQQDIFRKRRQTQFAGQFVSSHNSMAYSQFQTALISLNKDERSFCQAFILSTKYQINDFMECVHDDSSVSISKENDVYNLSQIQLGTKFINESASSLLLRTALICWSENSVLPNTLEKYKQFESNFKQNYFWKQIQQKDEMLKSMKIKNTIGTSAPTEQHLKELKQKIDKLVDDHTLPTEGAVSKRDQMVKALREEFAALKKKVVFDEYLNIKAQISVFRNEIEKLLIMASVKTLDSETAALAKCFTIQVPQIQYHIHPFQYFAATFYDKVDPNANMDVSNKVNIAQEFLTKVRNRSTEVETLTSGPGIVVPLKDLNEILIDFCRTSIQDQQKQFKSRAELSSIMEAHYRKSIFTKDQKIKSLERRIDNIGLNLDFIINSKLFEKGNQLIYELDASNRLLEVFRKNMHFLEQKITEKVLGEQLEKFKRKNNHVEMKDQKFNDYKDAIMNMISADFAADQDRIKFILKQKAEQAKVIDKSTIQYKQINMYPVGNNNQTKDKDLEIQQNQGGQPNGLLTGAVVPKGFNHYPHCVCYMPDPRYPRPTLELAQLDMLSEMEARSELKQMCILVRKQRLLYRTKEMCLMSKYQTKINLLESQQNNNSLIWEQLAESDKREKVLKQELVFNQQSLALAHKQIENLTLEVRSLESEKGRLQKFKSQKVDKLRELEKRVKQIDMSELIDSDKLIAVLDKKEIEVRELHTAFDTMDSKLLMTERRKDKDIAKYKQKLQSEQIKNSKMVERMEQLKLELKAFDQNDTSVTSIWKKKCLDLFEVCQTVKKENDELRKRCSELITQGLSLADAIAGNSSIQLSAEQDFASNRKNTHFSTFTRGAPSQLPELTSHNQSSFINKPTSVFVDQSRNMTPQSNLPHPVQTSQQSRNKRQNSQFQSLLSKEVGSEDVQNEILMNSARWGSKKIVEFSAEIPSTGVSSTQNNRGRSLGHIPAIQNQKKSNVGSQNVQQFTGDIRSILCNQDDLRLSDMDVRSQPNSGGKVTMRDKKNQKIFDNAIKRRNKNFGLHSVQDSLFIHQNSTQHSQISGQNIITTGSNAAIQQLKDASRFRGLDLKGVSYSAMQAQPPNSAQSPKNLSERENPLSQRNVRKIPLVQKNEIDSSENLGSQGSLQVPNQRMDDEEDQVAQIIEVSKH